MSKGMSGEAVRTIIILVIAVLGLVILWVFFSGYTKYSAFGLEDITSNFRSWFCDAIPVVAKFALCHF